MMLPPMKKFKTNATIFDLITKNKKRVFILDFLTVSSGSHDENLKILMRGLWHTKAKNISIFGIPFIKKAANKTLLKITSGLWKNWKDRPVILKLDGKRKRPMLLTKPDEIFHNTFIGVSLVDINNIDFLKAYAVLIKKKKKKKTKISLKNLLCLGKF